MGRRTIRSERAFGIEIEAYGVPAETVSLALNAAGIVCHVQGYNHVTTQSWKIVPDASIRGTLPFELVSPILYGTAGLAAIRTVCTVLQALGVQVNKSCGMHVHHAASDLTIGQWKNLAKSFLKYEAAFDQLVPVSRRRNNNTYCASLRLEFPSLDAAFAAINEATTLRELAQILGHGSRYYKLNLQSFWRHGTVEFRQHGGSIDAEKICAWILLTNGLIEDACAVAYILQRGAESLKSLLAITAVPAATARFFQARAFALAG